MNKLKYLIFLLLIASMFSCYDDKSTVDTLALSEITVNTIILSEVETEINSLETEVINGEEKKVINIEKNETLTIEPVIVHSGKEYPLTYEWEINYEVVSTEKTLVYVGNELGTFPIRLKVTNQDGSTFVTFILNVNSPYEEGVFVLTENPDGNGNIAFLRTLTDAEKAEGSVEVFENNCFTTNNPDLSLGKGVSDVKKRANQLYIASADEGKISVINTKTFQLEGKISATDIPDFQPYRLNVPDNTGRSALILSKDGKVYKLATLEFLVLEESGFSADVQLLMKTDFMATYNYTSNYFWDEKNAEFLYKNEYSLNSSKTTLSNQSLITFFATLDASYILTRDKNDPTLLRRTKFAHSIEAMDYSDYSTYVDILEQESFVNATSSLKSTSITILNTVFNKLIYANDNKIYSWYYSGTNIPEKPFIELDITNEVVDMNISPDGEKLYVAAYNENASGLKGSLFIYNADNGALIAKYENVFDKPIRVFYKNKN